MRRPGRIGLALLAPLVATSLASCGGSDAGVQARGSASVPPAAPASQEPASQEPMEATPEASAAAPTSGTAATLSDLFAECLDGAGITVSNDSGGTVATDKASGHTYTIHRFPSEPEAEAYVDGLDVDAYAHAGELVAVGDSDDATTAISPVAACLHAEEITNG